MRAQKDLVCASSSCPDDIDPSNAWVPTDIHVRVYDAERKFSMAVATRITPDAPAQLTKQTGFHSRTSALTKQFTEYRGYWLPSSYDGHGAVEEYWACREGVVVMDLSPLRKFEVLGPDAEALLQSTLTRNIRKLSHGQVVYSAMCNETGGMIDDGTRLPTRRQQFPLGRRRRLRRRVAAPSRPSGWAWTGCGCALDRRRCTTSPCRARTAARC